MGLFHDVCEALIDLRTGEALAGSRLVEAEACLNVVQNGQPVHLEGAAKLRALAEHGWGVCGNKVSKRARVCSMCGHGAPGGWVKCPACGKWVGNESKFCPHCNHPLHPGERSDLAGGVWDRAPGVFAQRFELGDMRRILARGLNVQEGTVALLLDGGKVVKTLESGRHTPEGTLRAINWFGNPPPRSAVMVESGDVVVRLQFDGLRASDETPVNAMAELTFRFDPRHAVDFIANVFKNERELPLSALTELFRAEASGAVRDLCQASTIEDLVKDPERRPRFEDAIRTALRDLIVRSGFELVRVGAVDFSGPGYEKLRASYGDLEEKRRQLEFSRQALDLMADEEQMGAFDARRRDERDAAETKETAHREKEVSDYLAQLAQEKGLSEITLSTEMEIARKAARGELSKRDAELAAADVVLRHAADLKALANRHELELIQKNFTRDDLVREADNRAVLAAKARAERLLDSQTDTAVAKEQFEQVKVAEAGKRVEIDTEIYKARQGQELLRELKAIKTGDMVSRLDAIRGASATELAFVADDPELRAQLLQQELAKANLQAEQAKMQVEAALSPEQLLARAAATSSAAAEALAKLHGASAAASERVLEEVKKLTADRQTHDERQWQRIADLAQESIRHQNTTIVPPASPVAPTTQIVH